MSSAALPPLPKEDLESILEHTRDCWAEAKGRSFFITGGTGFFGLWLLESFARINADLELGARAVVLTRRPEAFAARAPHLANRPDLVFLEGDVRSFAFPPGVFDYVIHAATESGSRLNEERPGEMLESIIGGANRVLGFAAQAGTRKLLLTSSGAVYGRQPPAMTHIAEDYAGGPDPLNPGSAYAEGKRVAEHLCVLAAKSHGFESKIARCFAFVGPHLPLDAHFAIGNFMRNALRDEPIRVGGDGTPHRSYLYAADLAAWLWVILFWGQSCRAYNVGSDEGESISTHARRVDELRAAPGRIQVAHAPAPGLPPSRYVPEIRRAREELGLDVWITESEGIRRTLAWHRLAGD